MKHPTNILDTSGLTHKCQMALLDLYSVLRQTILLVNGEPLGMKGLIIQTQKLQMSSFKSHPNKNV